MKKLTTEKFEALARIMRLREGSKSREGMRLMLVLGVSPADAAREVDIPRQNMNRQWLTAQQNIKDCYEIAGKKPDDED